MIPSFRPLPLCPHENKSPQIKRGKRGVRALLCPCPHREQHQQRAQSGASLGWQAAAEEKSPPKLELWVQRGGWYGPHQPLSVWGLLGDPSPPQEFLAAQAPLPSPRQPGPSYLSESLLLLKVQEALLHRHFFHPPTIAVPGAAAHPFHSRPPSLLSALRVFLLSSSFPLCLEFYALFSSAR